VLFDNNTTIIPSRHAPLRSYSRLRVYVPRGEKQFLTGSVFRADRALMLRPDPQGVGVWRVTDHSAATRSPPSVILIHIWPFRFAETFFTHRCPTDRRSPDPIFFWPLSPQSFHLFLFLSLYLSLILFLSMYLSIYLFIHIYIYIYIYHYITGVLTASQEIAFRRISVYNAHNA